MVAAHNNTLSQALSTHSSSDATSAHRRAADNCSAQKYRCLRCGFNASSFHEMGAHISECTLVSGSSSRMIGSNKQLVPTEFISKSEARKLNQHKFTENTTGVRFSKVKEFITKLGGREAFKNMTTFDVVEDHIKPLTRFETATSELKNVSFAEFLYHSADASERAGTGDAVLFISHAWTYDFLEVVDSIERYVSKDEQLGADPVIWLDILCVSQHLAGHTDTAWFLDTFMEAVRQMKRVLQILSPYDDPAPIHRGWCVFEVFSCAATQGQFAVTFPDSQLRLFVEAVLDDWTFLRKMFAKLQTRNCACGRPGEPDAARAAENAANLAAIRAAVERKGLSFEDLDGVVLKALQEAAVDALGRMAAEEQDSVRKGRLLRSLGVLYKDVGRFAEALETLEAAVPVLTRAEGREGDNTLRALTSLGAIYGKLRRFEEQLRVHEEVLAACEARGGGAGERESTLLARSNVATTLANLGRVAEALAAHRGVLASKRAELGEAHEDTLRSMNEVGVSLLDVGAGAEAAAVLARCCALRTAVLGRLHRDTADTRFWLGKARLGLGRFAEAEADLAECVRARRRAMPASHPLVGQATQLLEVVRERRRRGSSSEEEEAAEEEAAEEVIDE